MIGSSRSAARRCAMLAAVVGVVALLPINAAARTKTPCADGQHSGRHRSGTPAAGDNGDGGDDGGGRPASGRARGGADWIALSDGVPKPVPSAAQQRDGLILFQRSVLERIYPDSHPRPDEMVAAVDLQAARGEYEGAQVAVYALRNLQDVRVSVSDLHDDAGHVIPASEITVRMVRFYGAQLAVAHRDALGVVPKTLEVAVPLAVPKETVRPYWITVHVSPDQPGGVYRGTVTVAHAAGSKTIGLAVDVVPVRLDEPDVLYGTLCVNVLSNLWKEHPKSGGTPGADGAALSHLQIADIVFRDQREHGATLISLRSGAQYEEQDGHPYLPDLEAAIDLYKKYGFSQPLVYCAGQLLHTNKVNRSNNYREYDADVHVPMAKKLAAYYTKRFRDEGLPGIAFMPVEEPNLKSGIGPFDAPDVRRRLATTLIGAMKEAGAKTALTCTPKSVTAAIDDTDYWIVAYRKFDPTLYALAKQHHAQLGVYANSTMMGQGTYFTRFLFGYFMWATGMKGMLPWTYPLQPKRFPINVEHRGEGGVNIHDEFIGLDNRPIPTVQWELSREGIDDAKYLATIERLAGKARALDTSAAKTAAAEADQLLAQVRDSVNRDIRHYTFEEPRTLAPQPQDGWDAARFAATRKRSVEVLKHLLAALPGGAGPAH